MAFYDAADLAAYDTTVDAPTFVTRYFLTAFEALNALSCHALTPAENDVSVSGIVAEDGVTVRLVRWMSKIDTVNTLDGATELSFTLPAGTADMTPDGKTDRSYWKTITLDTERSTGDIITVHGDAGFDPLPESLKILLSAAIIAIDNRATGDDRITSKQIGDVSVSRNSADTLPAVQNALQVYGGLLDKWSLCTDPYEIGSLDYPDPIHDMPWWVGDSDIWAGGDNAYGRAR